jgi:hypothetical protein
MNSAHRISSVIGILILLLLAVLVWQSFAQRSVSTQTVLLGVVAGLMAMVVMQSSRLGSDIPVEYKTVPVGSLTDATLQQCGKEGWRLICIDTSGAGYIFTR